MHQTSNDDATTRPRSSEHRTLIAGVAILMMAWGCTGQLERSSTEEADMDSLVRSSFKSQGIVTVEGLLDRDAVQRACSRPLPEIDAKSAADIQSDALNSVVYPAAGEFLGDWKRGEQIAQSGRGMQFSDSPGIESGGNCYACHRLSPSEVSFGTLGPSLHQYGKLRGSNEATLKYTWAKISDPHTYQPCSIMPRFGRNNILTTQQIRDVMALLLDPKSPVNQ